MTADDMGLDIVNSVRKMTRYQMQIQDLVGKEESEYYYDLTDYIFEYGSKYYNAWRSFNSLYVSKHRVEYEGQKMALEDMVRKQWTKELLNLDLREETRSAVVKKSIKG